MRINLILDYWYDEGAKDGSSYGANGNSQDYHKTMLTIRQLMDAQLQDQLTPGGPDPLENANANHLKAMEESKNSDAESGSKFQVSVSTGTGSQETVKMTPKIQSAHKLDPDLKHPDTHSQ